MMWNFLYDSDSHKLVHTSKVIQPAVNIPHRQIENKPLTGRIIIFFLNHGLLYFLSMVITFY